MHYRSLIACIDCYVRTVVTRTHPPRSVRQDIQEKDRKLLDKVILELAGFPASVLVDETHRDGGPWKEVFKNGSGNRSVIAASRIIELECRS